MNKRIKKKKRLEERINYPGGMIRIMETGISIYGTRSLDRYCPDDNQKTYRRLRARWNALSRHEKAFAIFYTARCRKTRDQYARGVETRCGYTVCDEYVMESVTKRCSRRCEKFKALTVQELERSLLDESSN